MKRHISLILLVLLCLTPVSVRYWIQETYGAECGLACRATTWYTEESFTSFEPAQAGCSEYSYTCSDDTVGQLARANLAVLGASSGAAAASTFCASATTTTNGTVGRVCEDMESTTACYSGGNEYCRNTWTIAESPDFNTATHLDGSHSVELNNTSAPEKIILDTGAVSDTLSLFFKVKFVALPASGARIFADISTPTSARCSIETQSDGSITTYSNTSGRSTAAVTKVSAGNTYYFWLDYSKNSGAGDGVCTACFSANTTKGTGNNCAALSTHADTTQVDTVKLGNGYSTQYNVTVVDDIFVDTDVIGDNP